MQKGRRPYGDTSELDFQSHLDVEEAKQTQLFPKQRGFGVSWCLFCFPGSIFTTYDLRVTKIQ